VARKRNLTFGEPAQEDPVHTFARRLCVPEGKARFSALYWAYRSWAMRDSPKNVLTARDFCARIEAIEGVKHANGWLYGITLK
jgi:hypothetical protein